MNGCCCCRYCGQHCPPRDGAVSPNTTLSEDQVSANKSARTGLMDWSGGETQDGTTKRIARDHFQDSKTWRPRAPFANYFDIRYAWWYRVRCWCPQQTLFSPISYPPSTHRPMCLSINNTNLNYETRVVWRAYFQVILSFVLTNCVLAFISSGPWSDSLHE